MKLEKLHVSRHPLQSLTPSKTGDKAGIEFASRFFGVPDTDIVLVSEAYVPDTWAENRKVYGAFSGDKKELLKGTLEAVDAEAEADKKVRAIYEKITKEALPEGDWNGALYKALSKNETLYQMSQLLDKPMLLSQLIEELADIPEISEFSPKKITFLRKKFKLSQAAFASVINISVSTVQKWEQGYKKPAGASMKLLDIIDRKGLQALI